MKRTLLISALAATGQLCAQTITEYRFWINDDPATLATASLAPATAVQLNATLDLPELTRDFNTITVQFKDDNGEYSVPQTTLYSKNSGALNGYEYWIDDGIANATGGTLGPDNEVDLIADLPTGTTSGAHTVTIRFSTVNGSWTVPLTRPFDFFTTVEELPGLSDVLLFPNPVTDQLGLRLSSDASRTLNLQVLDIQGALVRDLSTWSVSGTSYRNWAIGDLPDGTYVLRVSGDNGSWSTRFVKK